MNLEALDWRFLMSARTQDCAFGTALTTDVIKNTIISSGAKTDGFASVNI